MWEPCSEELVGLYSQDQNEKPDDRVLFSLCRTISLSFLYTLVYTLTTIVRCEMFSLLLLIGNFDHIIFGTRVWGP